MKSGQWAQQQLQRAAVALTGTVVLRDPVASAAGYKVEPAPEVGDLVLLSGPATKTLYVQVDTRPRRRAKWTVTIQQ